MANDEKLKVILNNFSDSQIDFIENSFSLFEELGYSTKRRLTELNNYQTFIKNFPKFNKENAHLHMWGKFAFLFQFADVDLNEILKEKGFSLKDTNPENAITFIAIKLTGNHHSDAILRHIAYELNRHLLSQTIILLMNKNYLNFVYTKHRINKMNADKDVLERIYIHKVIYKYSYLSELKKLKALSIDEIFNLNNRIEKLKEEIKSQPQIKQEEVTVEQQVKQDAEKISYSYEKDDSEDKYDFSFEREEDIFFSDDTCGLDYITESFINAQHFYSDKEYEKYLKKEQENKSLDPL